MKILASLSLFTFLALGCGSKTPAPTTTTGSATPVEAMGSGSDVGSAAKPEEPKPEPVKPAEPPLPPPPPELDAFMKLSKDEKTKIMKTKVMPAMAKAFKGHDPKKFAKLTCKTCHGKGAATDFKMPNPDMPALDFAALKEGKQEPKTAEFMGKVVEPDMAKILGVQVYDDAHPNGFGCLACHTMKK